MTGSNDILFLKRLLFLKATLDNEITVNNFNIPFGEESLPKPPLDNNLFHEITSKAMTTADYQTIAI